MTSEETERVERHKTITRVLPPTSRFSAANNHAVKKQSVLTRLVAFFDRYAGLL